MSPTLYPLASLSQIQQTPSRVDGISVELEEELRACGCRMICEVGVLLKQKQVAVATAQILFHRFWYSSSMHQFSISDISMGALYLGSKLEECPVRIRDLVNVWDLVQRRYTSEGEFRYTPMQYFSTAFYALKDSVVVAEMQILKRLGFNVHVVLPYGTLINYLRVLGLIGKKEVVQRAWGYLNDALQTPVYALYQIPTIVSAAILLSTRHLDISLPERWYELFDAEWEDVWSVAGYIMRLYNVTSKEKEDVDVKALLTKKALRAYLEGKK